MINAFIVFIAQYLIIVSAGIACIFFVVQPRQIKKEMAVFGFLAFLMTFVISRIAAHLYFDPRPFVIGQYSPLIPHTPDNGFPSDHTLLASAIAAVVFPYRRKLGLVLLALAFFIGAARVYAGVHHPVDIIGSIVIASAATALIYFASATLRRSLDKHQ